MTQKICKKFLIDAGIAIVLIGLGSMLYSVMMIISLIVTLGVWFSPLIAMYIWSKS